MIDCLTDYYRSPAKYARLALRAPLPLEKGYFAFGADTTCYGSISERQGALKPGGMLHDSRRDVVSEDGVAYLPFDPDEVIGNLRRETYVGDWRQGSTSILALLYYSVRPILPVSARKHLQRLFLKDWDKVPFPHWPVDFSVDNLLEELMLLSLRASGAERIPMIWFWPEAKSGCAIMTHDVESREGRDFCSTLMDINDSRGIKASFQIIPEERYAVSREFLSSIRQRGFEIAVHDLNHDGHLYRNYDDFLRRVAKINSYVRQYEAGGFRAGVLYRRQLWYDALKCSYDMSVPNVAHLDPQRGGCCTVMPYFLGDILELPVTTIQDYSLFNILNDYSIELWKVQTTSIMQKHGLMSFIVHPDYIMGRRERQVYELLLDYLAQLRQEHAVWIATPGEVNNWWRQRAQMRLVECGNGWRIEGEGKERARIAYASEVEGHVVLTLDGPGSGNSSTKTDTGSNLAGVR